MNRVAVNKNIIEKYIKQIENGILIYFFKIKR